MRKIIGMLVLVLGTTIAAFGQDDPIVQVGYAVITPTSGQSLGLIAFETFGLRVGSIGGATQAGVLPPNLTTSAMLFIQRSLRLNRNTGFAVVNPNSSDVTLSMSVLDENGSQLAATSLLVAAHKQIAMFVPELFTNAVSVPNEFTGSLIITVTGTSPQPVSITGLRFRGTNFSALPATSLVPSTSAMPTITAGVGGANAILLPQFAAGGGWATELVIGNSSGGPISFRVDLFKSDGTPMPTTLNSQIGSSFTNLTVASRGVFKLVQRNGVGDDDF